MVGLVLPLYYQIDRKKHKLSPVRGSLRIPLADRTEPIKIWETMPHPNLKVFFVQSDTHFNRRGFYGDSPDSAYDDNDRRFALLSRSALEIARKYNFRPDIVHCHDWQTGLVPANLKTHYFHDSFFYRSASLFTIHNMAYQGSFPKESFVNTGLPPNEYHPYGIEFYGHVSYLKAGLVYSDAINTVSPTYAKEIQNDPNFGHGLEGILKERKQRFKGITNGLDTNYWNPAKDPHLAENFTDETLKNRAACQSDLRTVVGFKSRRKEPLLGYVGRLDYQKGIDLLLDIIPALVEAGAKIVVLGQGDSSHENELRFLMKQYPNHVFTANQFREALAHKIYAGVDLFLMPSRYEPCGLSQLIAMRYGALPVVMPTGGLLDTVKDAHTQPDGNGFIAHGGKKEDFLHAIISALNRLKDRDWWQAIQKRGMREDHSWQTAVHEYIQLYQMATRWYRREYV